MRAVSPGFANAPLNTKLVVPVGSGRFAAHAAPVPPVQCAVPRDVHGALRQRRSDRHRLRAEARRRVLERVRDVLAARVRRGIDATGAERQLLPREVGAGEQADRVQAETRARWRRVRRELECERRVGRGRDVAQEDRGEVDGARVDLEEVEVEQRRAGKEVGLGAGQADLRAGDRAPVGTVDRAERRLARAATRRC